MSEAANIQATTRSPPSYAGTLTASFVEESNVVPGLSAVREKSEQKPRSTAFSDPRRRHPGGRVGCAPVSYVPAPGPIGAFPKRALLFIRATPSASPAEVSGDTRPQRASPLTCPKTARCGFRGRAAGSSATGSCSPAALQGSLVVSTSGPARTESPRGGEPTKLTTGRTRPPARSSRYMDYRERRPSSRARRGAPLIESCLKSKSAIPCRRLGL